MPRKKIEKTETPATPAPRRRTTKASTQTNGTAPSNGSPAAHASPSYDQIAEAAYLRYLSRGGRHGSDFDDWVEAERELARRG